MTKKYMVDGCLMFISGPLSKICRVTLKVILRGKIRNGDFYRNTASRLQFVVVVVVVVVFCKKPSL